MNFIGLVFLRPENDLEEVLAPFDSDDYWEFVDLTSEIKKEYEKLPDTCPSEGIYTRVEDVTDFVNKLWDEAVDEPDTEYEGIWKPYTKQDFPTPADIAKERGLAVIPDETKRDGLRFERSYEDYWIFAPSKEKYPTLDDFAREYHSYIKRDNKFGYFHNPNEKFVDSDDRNGFVVLTQERLTEIDWESTDTIPFCFVDAEGVWHEKGKSWWGMIIYEKTKRVWEAELKDYVKSLLTDPEAEEIEVYTIDFNGVE